MNESASSRKTGCLGHFGHASRKKHYDCFKRVPLSIPVCTGCTRKLTIGRKLHSAATWISDASRAHSCCEQQLSHPGATGRTSAAAQCAPMQCTVASGAETCKDLKHLVRGLHANAQSTKPAAAVIAPRINMRVQSRAQRENGAVLCTIDDSSPGRLTKSACLLRHIAGIPTETAVEALFRWLYQQRAVHVAVCSEGQ